MNLKVSEIFYSLQGEGARIGTPTVFIRLTGCKTKNACFAAGIKCDTEFESGKELSITDIELWLKLNAPKCKEITWTGGEPTDQLTEEIISYFKNLGFYQAIETSGLNPVPKGIDFICVSPKVAEVPDVPEVPDEPSPPVEPSRFMSHALYVPEPTTCVGVPNTRAPVIGLYVVTTVS